MNHLEYRAKTVALGAGLVAFIGMALSVLLTYDSKVKAFMADIAGEDPLMAGPTIKGD
jgi:hypothetical protein